MRQLFISPERRLRPRWLVAFPDLELLWDVPPGTSESVILWLSLGEMAGGGESEESLVVRLVATTAPVVVLSPSPGQAEAFHMLSLGVRGYCHVEAVPEQLLAVAEVVAAGDLWMPPSMVRRLASVAQRFDITGASLLPSVLEGLTPREHQVALLVGRGHNNREIAAELGVSERTVKANLTVIFEKLALRDRVQLALYVNRLPIH